MRQLNHFSILFTFLLFSGANCQFGEIASIVTGLLGSGAGGAAGLGSLAGPAAIGAAAGTAGAQGAGGALGSIGPLYQLAQAALSLTGTGVGIVNQASESAWFPAAIENAARMNRDFQDRLINGQGGANKPGRSAATLPDLFGLNRPMGGLTPPTSEIGTEFGKDLETGETEETESPDLSPIALKTTTAEPDLPAPSISTGIRPLPALVPDLRTLLPGEVPTSDRSDVKTEDNGSSPTITVQIPEKHQEEKPQMEFSIDSTEDAFPLLPPHAISPSDKAIGSEELHIDEKMIPHMVPELQKLLRALQNSNLTRADLSELSDQLEGNKNIGTPRENSTPVPSDVFLENRKPPSTPEEMALNEDRKKAVDRNLLALRRALSVPTVGVEGEMNKYTKAQETPPVILALSRPSTLKTTEVKYVVPNSGIVPSRSSKPATPTTPSSSAPRAQTIEPISSESSETTTTTTRLRLDSDTGNVNRPQSKGAKNLARTSPIALTPQQEYERYRQEYQQYYQKYFANQNPQPMTNLQAQPLAQFNYYGQNPSGNFYYAQQTPQPTPIYSQQPFVYNPTMQQPGVAPQSPIHSTNQYVRSLPNPPPFTPLPQLLQHPFSHGSLLTLPQSGYQNGR